MKKLNNKIIIKSKNQLWDENDKLKEKVEDLERRNKQLQYQYDDLKDKSNYLVYHLNKIMKILPQFIKDLVNRLFNHKDIKLKFFKKQYDSEVKEQELKRMESRRRFNLFNKKEIEKTTEYINDEINKSAEEFYNTKKDKEKDDGLSL